jgi:hypothetical protein
MKNKTNKAIAILSAILTTMVFVAVFWVWFQIIKSFIGLFG